MWCRFFLIAMLFVSATIYAATPEVEAFKKTWIANTLKLQREIDINVRFSQATFLGTHNSENSLKYQIPFLRYVDPNQILSIYDQLEMGIRSIELDVHWYLDANWKKDILLSHALPNHVGCSSFDRPVIEGLAELRDWLKQNPGEVVLLYIDRGIALDGHEPRLTFYLQQYLGDYIYKPTFIQKSNAPACVSLPTTIRKADVLNAGKQLLIITKNCDGANPPYEEQDQFKLNWNDFVFAGMGDVPDNKFTFLDSAIGDDFTAYPDCSKSTIFAADTNHTILWRIFEDRTILSNIVQPQRKILEHDVTTMTQCGINWPSFDMLTANDERLKAAIWSWEEGYPHDGQGDCALYKNTLGIENAICSITAPGFVCQNTQTNEFKVLNISGKWEDGDANCSTLGNDWHFAVPVNGSQMYLVKQMLQEAGLSEVWLRYRMDNGHWQAN